MTLFGYQFGFMSTTTGAFSPADLGGLYMWFDASDSSTLTIDTGKVIGWDDKSGNGRNLTEGGNVIVDNSTFSNQTLYFDGTRNVTRLYRTFSITNLFTLFPDGITHYIVSKWPETETLQRSLFGWAKDAITYTQDDLLTGNYGGLCYFGRIKNGSVLFITPPPYPPLASNKLDLVKYSHVYPSPYTHTIEVNDSIISASANIDPLVGRFTIGECNDSTENWIGNLAEFLVYDKILTTEEDTKVKTYLKNKWQDIYV
jgi:hypothetical protein